LRIVEPMTIARPNGPGRYEYVLGDSKPEAIRLEQQAKLWDPLAMALFERIGVTAGSKVLEVGPGRGSVHVELRRRVQGPIDAVERSAAFAEAVRDRTRADGFGEGRIWQTDLISAALRPNRYDLIYARWVFCFLPDPGLHIKKLVRALKAGGLLAIQDYAHRDSFALFPRPTEWLDFLAADRALFASHGGDVSVGGRLPTLYKEAGLDVVDVTPIHMSGPPGSPVWEWLFRYFDSVRERIARIAPLDGKKTTSLYEHWRAAATDRQAFIIAPTMVDVVGRK
jgi:SAM-dependent methyltransferase